MEELENNDNSKLIPVIFQLNSPMTDSDENHLANLGFELLGRAPLVDGGLVEGTIGEVRALSNWERIEYLELDKPLEFFYLPSEWGGEPTTDAGIMMHETTHVVTATDSWSRAIISPSGEVEYEIDQSFTEWDGDGTAIVDLDTGVDAGHPDYDYLEPWTGDKAIYSVKNSMGLDGLKQETRIHHLWSRNPRWWNYCWQWRCFQWPKSRCSQGWTISCSRHWRRCFDLRSRTRSRVDLCTFNSRSESTPYPCCFKLLGN